MKVELTCPDWMKDGSVTLRLMELNPHAVEALIETLRDATETDDDRIRLLLDLGEAMTGE